MNLLYDSTESHRAKTLCNLNRVKAASECFEIDK